MNKKYILIFCYLVTIFLSCTKNTDTEKYQNKRNNITSVKENVVEIVKDDVLIGSSSRLYLTDDYLIIQDIRSADMLIHLFDRNNYQNILPEKLLVFNINGDYIKTLDIGYKILDLCYDERNESLLLAFDDMIQFGYLTLNESMLE